MTEFGFIDRIKDLFATLPDNGFEGIGDDCTVLPSAAANRSSSLRTCSPKGCISARRHLLTGTGTQIPRRKPERRGLDGRTSRRHPAVTLAARRCDRSVGRRVHAGLPGAVPRIRRNAHRGRHHPLGGGITINVTAIGRAADTLTNAAAEARPGDVDFYGGSARSLRGGPARHSRGPLQHPRRCRTPQSPAAGRPKASGSASGTKYMP